MSWVISRWRCSLRLRLLPVTCLNTGLYFRRHTGRVSVSPLPQMLGVRGWGETDIFAMKNSPGSFVKGKRRSLEKFAMESLSLICVKTGFLFWPMLFNMVSKYKSCFSAGLFFHTAWCNYQWEGKPNSTSRAAWDEQTPGVTHVGRMTFDSALTPFANE